MKLRAPVNAQLFDGTGTGTITNDEPMVTIGNPEALEGDSGTTAAALSGDAFGSV